MKQPAPPPDARPTARPSRSDTAAPDDAPPTAETPPSTTSPGCAFGENGEACGATPTVGGDPKYRYCGKHLAQIERTGGPVYRDGWA